jgi:KipI family sensor histidine kinase inhibitor
MKSPARPIEPPVAAPGSPDEGRNSGRSIMTINLRPAGDRALLLETGDPRTTVAVAEILRAAALPEVEHLVPAAATVLVQVARGTDLDPFGRQLLDLAAGAESAEQDTGAENGLIIPVTYDGPDLADVAAASGLSEAEVIAAHTGTPWRAAFVGFAPGFAYLVGGDPRLAVPRRVQSRTSVPAGSVALAGEYSAVYPRESPGGWQLIGTTDTLLWDETAEPPAAIQPGRWVRFVNQGGGA